ncbi:MAG TPA: TonB-dependent receptor [Stellaceae bacterium]|nr:TonB-dependent receptor [Stellaceae bacterium]
MVRRSLTAGVCATAILTGLPAFAADESGALQEIVVTAQKRAQNVQDVGIAVQAITGDTLRQLNLQSSFDIAALTPGVSIGGSLAGQQSLFTIRGVSQIDFNDIAESPNAVYFDEGYVAIDQAQTFSLLDIDHVEVLKGPQGTLFGRNATGGLIQYISKKPSFDGYDGYVDVRIGVYDSPENPMQEVGEAAFGGPINDYLAARIAVKYLNRDPYLINKYPLDAVGPPPGPGAGADLGNEGTFVGRVELLYKPSADFQSLLTGFGGHTDTSTAPYEQSQTIGQLNAEGQLVNVYDISPTDTRDSISATGGDGGADEGNTGHFTPAPPRPVPGGDFFGFKPPGEWVSSCDFCFAHIGYTDTYGVDLDNTWNIAEGLTFTAVSDYKKFNKLLFVDVDAGPTNQLADFEGDDSFTFSQEFRLNGTMTDLNWVAGAYYLHIDNSSIAGLKIPTEGIEVDSLASLQTDSFSVFGQGDWTFADHWTIVAGLRGIEELKNYHFSQGLFPAPNAFAVGQGPEIVPLGPNPGGAPYANDSEALLWAGKLQLEYRPETGVLIYAGVNRGVKAGSYNAELAGGLPVPTTLIPYKPEELVSTEAGFKSTFLDNKLRVNASAFHYDYTNYQAFLFTGVAGVVLNRNAETNGAEATIEANPFPGFDVDLSGSYIHARVFDVPLLIGGGDIPTRTVQPVYSPPFQANLLMRYSHEFMSGVLSERFDVTYSDHYYYNLRNFDADQFPHYYKLGLGASWLSPDEHWQVGFDIDNLTNARIGVQGFDLASLCGCNEVSYQLPRSYSLNLHYAF